jgi:endoglucanase
MPSVWAEPLASPGRCAAALLVAGAFVALATGCGHAQSPWTSPARDCGRASLAAAQRGNFDALYKVLTAGCARRKFLAALPCKGSAASNQPIDQLRPAPDASGLAVPRAFIRVNQVGYPSGCPKRALLMSARPIGQAAFHLLDSSGSVRFSGRIGASRGGWGVRWPHIYGLDFGRFSETGRYVLRVGGVRSPEFRIGEPSKLYAPLAANEISFFQTQRDGPDLVGGSLRRRPSHLHDRHATVYANPRYRGTKLIGSLTPIRGPINVSGGWFDAGDYLKFTGTASFSDALMFFALRDFGYAFPQPAALAHEARFGIDWLMKMWDPTRRVLYYQVGIGDGNGKSILGDHDLWRLPERDDRLVAGRGSPDDYIANRPVFAANAPGGPISPNISGRVAAAFGLCAQYYASFTADSTEATRCLRDGQMIFDQADTRWRGPLLASSPAAYYAEPEWRDDMELGAVELYLGTLEANDTGLPHPEADYYLEPAARWANAYMSGRLSGRDSLNLYDVAALAHYDLYRVMQATGNTTNLETNASQILRDLADQLTLGARLGQADPFRLSNTSGPIDTDQHALGYAIEARLYGQLAGRPRFEALAEDELNWVLGENPWGSAFVVGAGSAYPRCLAHQVANLEGTLAGGVGPTLLGAVVNGPTASRNVRTLGAPDGFRRCPANRGDPYRPFDARGFAYLDDVTSPATSEPADDSAALALLAFAQQAAFG